MKSPADVDKEGAILTEMLEIVEQKDSLRSMLEEDRQRWAVFLNLIDLTQRSLEDDVFESDSASEKEYSNEPNWQSQVYSDQFLPTQGHNHSSGQAELIDSDLEIEEEIEQLFNNNHSETTSFSGSMNDLFALDNVESENWDVVINDQPVKEHVDDSSKANRPSKIVWSPSIEYEGQIVQLKDLISHEELEMWSTYNPVEDQQIVNQQESLVLLDVEMTVDDFKDQTLQIKKLNTLSDVVENGQDEADNQNGSPVSLDDMIDEQEVEEFDQLVEDLSDDGTASLGSCLVAKRPNLIEYEDQTTTVNSNLLVNQQGDLESLSNSSVPDCDANSDCERQVNGRSCEYFYERRQTIDETKQRKTSQILKEKVEVFDELDRKVRKRVEAVEEEHDWGSLGVKFENRGVVRDLVWMWEYNHLQQSGRRGVYPDLDDRPKKRNKPLSEAGNQSGSGNDLESNEQQEQQPEQRQRTRKKRKKVESSCMESEKTICQSDPVNGWAWWQIGILFWLVVFSFFILSTLPADSLPFVL